MRPAMWHWFALKSDDDPRSLFAFPGIWRRYTGPLKKDGPEVELDVCSIMTTTPNDLTAAINHERMPVLLASEANIETWMRGTPEEAFALLRPFPASEMRGVGAGLEKRDTVDTMTPPKSQSRLL